MLLPHQEHTICFTQKNLTPLLPWDPSCLHLEASKHITLIQTLPEADRVPVTPWRFHKVASNNMKMIPLPLSQEGFQQNQHDSESQQTLPQGRRVPITPLPFFYHAHIFLLHEHMPLSTPAAVMHGTMPSCMTLTVKAMYNSVSPDASGPGALAPTISQL